MAESKKELKSTEHTTGKMVSRTSTKKPVNKWLELISHLPDPVARLDKKLQFVFVNKAFLKSIRRKKSEIIGNTNYEIGIPSTIAAEWTKLLKEVFKTGKPAEMKTYYPEGEDINYTIAKIIPEPDESGVVQTVLTIGRDVSDIKQIERQLRESKNLLQNIIDAPNIGIAVFKAIRNRKGVIIDFVHEFVNQRTIEAIGKDVTGIRLSEWGSDGTEQINLFKEVVETGKKNSYTRKAESGTVDGWFLFSNAPLGNDKLVHVWEDVTNIKKAEQEAEEALVIYEDRMRGLKEAYYFAVNGAAMKESLHLLTEIVTRETGGAAKTAFYLADSNVNYLTTIRGAGNMTDEFADQVDGFITGKNAVSCGLAVTTGKPVLISDIVEEPSWVPYLSLAEDFDFRGCWSFPIKTKDQQVVGAFAMYFKHVREATLNDVGLAELITHAAAVIISNYTETQRLNKSIVTANRELEGANAELAAFNTVAANDYQDLLKNLYVSLELIRTGDMEKLSNHGSANLRRAQAAIQKMKLLTEDLVSYSKLHQPETREEKVGVNAALESAKKSFVKKHEDVKITIDCAVHLLTGYPSLLSILFEYLFENAEKSRKKDTAPEIKVSCAEFVQASKPEIGPNGKKQFYNVINISDNGVGYENSEKETLFDFLTTLQQRDPKKGSRVKLAICKKIMQLHGGFINVESAPNKGAKFSCYFPILNGQ